MEQNPQDGFWVEPIRELGYEVIEIERHGHADFRRFWRLCQLLRQKPWEIVHIFNDSQPSLYSRLAAVLTRQPYVIINERRHPSADPKWYRRLKRWWLNRQITAMVANARSSLDYAITTMHVPSSKTHYIPNGIDLGRFQRDPDLDARALLPDGWRAKIIVGTVGSLLSKKSPDVFVRVARQVIDACPDARFLHVGTGPLLPAVETLRNELGLSEYLHFAGMRTDVPHLLQAFDIFLMTSRNEGMPNAAMEAMAMSLPCVVTDAGDSREVVRDGETGFVVPIGDTEALSAHIIRLINDEALRQTLGQRGHTIIQDFSVERMAERYSQLYASLLAKKPVG